MSWSRKIAAVISSMKPQQKKNCPEKLFCCEKKTISKQKWIFRGMPKNSGMEHSRTSVVPRHLTECRSADCYLAESQTVSEP